ncbi:DNA topoisomerase 2-binding protein 1 isoform X2 [Leptidea sinapis]|uniref:DNA topoisomerase 2-binding protein 1 isoform X2 n=1 Tax=Leptidea sinapis TaxID=189913 RepID=UPI0021C25DDD|nr:DNA topoisomerase 2-binding protein 1 isoform X2 [Leptidea sinapis]
MNEDINVTFIIPKGFKTENECSEDMKLAFTACEQHSGGGINAKWVHEEQWTKFDGLTKRDVLVITDFKGDLFHKLRATKCLLVGPRCLSCCLTESTSIPSGPEPVYTIAMRGLVVTASGFTKEQKADMKNKVYWMGGLYNNVLTEDTTHLISDTVLSDKYSKSVEKGIPIMSAEWVQAVWDASLQLNVTGSSADFDSYRLPPFTNLQVTTSGLGRREKQNIMKLVNENGGTFSGAFQSESTDVVVLNKDGVTGDKYKAALEYGKWCVVPAWVVQSAERGVALPFSQFRVAGASTSSPLPEHRLPDMSLDFSRIGNARALSNIVNETRPADFSTTSRTKLSQEIKKNDTSMDKEIVEEFEKFDMSLIKKAGPIFDGFGIWLVGLEGVCRERAGAMISRCGGVRYDSPGERVTHAAGAGRGAVRAAAGAPHLPVLDARWLLHSVRERRALREADYLMNSKPQTPVKSRSKVEPASPMSKRNLQLLRPELHLPPPSPQPPPSPPHDDLVNHYLSQQMEEPHKTPEKSEAPRQPHPQHPDITEDLQDEPTEEIEQIFRGIKIEVCGLDEEAICEIGAEVSAAGGVLVAAGGGGQYRLVPLDWDEVGDEVPCVTVFWIKDCISSSELLEVQYFHRPVRVAVRVPLAGVVASLSTYSGVERAFLDRLAELCGATTQLRFCRRTTANATASTHLICPTPVGDKYQGAVKWGLPAVTAQWLLDCAEKGVRLHEGPYLVGDTTAPPLPEQEDTKVEETSIEGNKTHGLELDERNKENDMLPPAGTHVPRRGSLPKDETPKQNDGDGDEMSPASRYIAMARQGLLGGDTQGTPKQLQRVQNDIKQAEAMCTPPLDDALSSPNLVGLSPTTRRRLTALRRGEMPSDPPATPTDPFASNIQTPDSEFGAALRPGTGRLSPESRKRLWRVVHDLPAQLPQREVHKQTPLSEIRNRFLAQFNSGSVTTPPSDHTIKPRKLMIQDEMDTPPAKMMKSFHDQSAGTAGTTSENKEKMTPMQSWDTEIERHDSKISNKCSSAAEERQENTTTSNKPDTSTHENSSNVASTDDSSSKMIGNSIGAAVDAQLQRLSAALTGRLSSQRARRSVTSTVKGTEPEGGAESQPSTVGWDDTTPVIRRFMLSSNVDNSEEIMEIIRELGGELCEGAELDFRATHLLCAVPGRSEKMLCSVASGKWVLHPAYVARSKAAGKFLDEEEWEWGNPAATSLPALGGGEAQLARAAHRWRLATAHGGPGPFRGVAAILHVPPARATLLARLLRAGGGLALSDSPPYSSDEATVCFADVKRLPLSERDATWLRSKRIPVCPPVLLSSYLTEEVAPKPEDHCLPEFRSK